jgi:hypothetical protein
MDLQQRIDLMVEIGKYFKADNEEWQDVKERSYHKNGWFTPEFIQIAATQIADNFLVKEKLQQWAAHYHIDDNIHPKNVGIVMAGNIPMVGFHDFLAVFISGHYQTVKLSSKDDLLLKHIFQLMYSLDIETQNYISISEMLKGCDAYIATGSNNSGRYFEQYFGKYPNIIRRNRTSAAILTGNETALELQKLSDDIHLYFGLGCRNVTKIYVPEGYDFVPLLGAFKSYAYFADHHKYKNNYDYQLSILLLNNIYYMTDGSTLLIDNAGLFSPISQLHYQFYKAGENPAEALKNNEDVQCIVGTGYTTFGEAQNPQLSSYADGVDTMQFLLGL